MSYTITVAAKAGATVAGVLAAVGEVRCVEAPEGLPDGAWPERILHFHVPGRSTRGVELTATGDEAAVRLVSLANLDDWELGLRFLAAFAADGATLEGEDGSSAPLAEKRRLLEAMPRENAAAYLAMKGAATAVPPQRVSFSGPVREVFLGARTFRDLPADDGAAIVALLERVRRLQYLEDEGIEVCAPIELMRAVGVLTTLWDPTKRQAFVETDHLGLKAPSGSLHLPVAAIPSLVGERFQWLDEKQFLVEATPAAELPALHQRAAAVAVDPYAKPKKWWQFWK